MSAQHHLLRPRQFLIAALLWTTIFNVGAAKTAAQATNCPGAPASRLTVGSEVHVTPGSANNLRDKPGKTGRILSEVPGDAYVYVLKGPQCADNLAWWKVYYDQVGWMAEGSGSNYFIEPAAQTILFKVDTGKILISYHTISFIYRRSFGDYIQAVTVPAAQGSQEAPIDITAPEYVEFDFLKNQSEAADDYHKIVARIYPANEFESMNRDAKDQLPALKALLKSRPTSIRDEIPFQPSHYARQVFHSNIAFVEFNSGAGLRFLTEWTQNTYPVLSGLVVYDFQGFTEDAKYFVSAEFPVTSNLLAANADEDQDFGAIDFNADDGAEQYAQYKAKIAAKLNNASSKDFKPPLDEIDALIRSISIVTVKG